METKVNMAEGLYNLDMMANQIRNRLESVLEHLYGPRPEEAQNAVPASGLLSAMERLAATQQRIERAVTQLENSLGVHAVAKNVAGNGLAANTGSPLLPRNY